MIATDMKVAFAQEADLVLESVARMTQRMNPEF